MGIGLLQMEGNIEFYKHAGFDLASKMKIHYHAEPRDAEVPYFLAQELIPGTKNRFSVVSFDNYVYSSHYYAEYPRNLEE